MARRSRFQAPRKISSFDEVQQALAQIQADLDATTRNRVQLKVYTQDFAAVAGGFHRVSSLAAGLDVRMPKAGPANLGDAVILHLEDLQGDVVLWAAPGDTINGEATATFSVDGVVTLWSNGVNSWSGVAQTPAESPSGEALDAEYVLGSTHASLPNGRVATNSTEVDVVLTTPNVITWALNLASIAFSKLANLAGLSVLGRAANSSGVMAAITASAGSGAVLRESGSVLGFGTVANAGLADMAAGTAKGRLHSAGTGAPQDLTRLEQGQNLRQGTFQLISLAGGSTHNNVAINDGVTQVFITVTGAGTATISGFDYASGDFAGARFKVVRSVNSVGGDIVIQSEGAGSNTQNRVQTPGAVDWTIRKFEDGIWIGRDSGTASTTRWRIEADFRLPQFEGIRDNGSLETARPFLNLVNSTSVTLTGTQDAGNDEIEVTAQRAALTGFAAATANSNATTSAESIVTFAPSANMSAERVLSDGLGTVVDTGTAGQIKLNLTTQTNGGAVIAHRVTFAATGTAGTNIDVTIWNANAPFLLRLLGADLRVSTAVGGTTAALRTATAGGGAVILPDAAAATQTFSTAAAGLQTDNAAATETVAANGTVILRIDRAIAGEVVLYYRA